MRVLEGKTVLVVDDEREIRELLTWEIQNEGGQTLEASSGRSALQVLQDSQVDAVVSDIRMPDGDGVELLEKIRDRSPDTPVVILVTGHSDFSISDVFDKGAEGYFVKPFSIGALVKRLGALLEPRSQRWKRGYTRVDVNQVIEVEGKTDSGALLNIGRGGFFVALDKARTQVGEVIAFRFHSPYYPNEVIEGTGTVRWVRTDLNAGTLCGYGVEFLDLADHSLALVVDWIDRSLTATYIPNK